MAKTLALNKRGKKDGNMQPCQPGWGIAGQRQSQRLAPRMGTRPGHVPGWKKAVSTRWVCLLGLAGIACKKGTRKGRWATLATASSSSN